MASGKLKSRSVRIVKKRDPTKTTTHYVRRKPSKAQCAGCGVYLHGVARAASSKISNMPKTKKRPERPYGGVLCSKCSRKTILSKIRSVFSLKK